MREIKFDGYNLALKFLRSDKSVRVEIDTSIDQYDNIKDIPKLPDGVYEIVIKPKVEVEDEIEADEFSSGTDVSLTVEKVKQIHKIF